MSGVIAGLIGAIHALLSLFTGHGAVAPTATFTDDQNASQIVQQIVNPLPQTSLNTAPTPAPDTSSSAAAMIKYTDSDFGFSFWYPSSTEVHETKLPTTATAYGHAVEMYGPNIRLIKKITIPGVVDIDEVYSPDTITVKDTSLRTYTLYFDKNNHVWMRCLSADGVYAGNCKNATDIAPADVSNNSMGGLHIISTLGATSNGLVIDIVPLSAHNFVVIYHDAEKIDAFARTIMALDPSVATPVSAAEQTATIQAEAKAYGVASAPVATKTYTDSVNGFSFAYPASLPLKVPSPTSDSVGVTLATLTSGPEVLEISMNTDPTAVGHCMVTPQSYEDGVSNASTVTLNGVSFLTYDIGDAAMGHYTDDKMYHAIHNNACFSLTKTTSTSRVSSDEESKTQTDSVNAASGLLDSVIQSFTFAANTTAQPPTCTLTSDKFSYKLGDVIALTWKSKSATRALWDQDADKNSGVRKVIVPPEGTPGVSGSGATVANLEGYQTITLQVVGPGGFGSCATQVSISHSSATPSITVTGVSLDTTKAQLTTDRSIPVLISGTATNGGLYNDEVNLVLYDAAYTGSLDEASVYSDVNRKYFYAGGAQPGLRDDSKPFETWSASSYVPRGVSSVRVLGYYPYYGRSGGFSSNSQPMINVVLPVTQ